MGIKATVAEPPHLIGYARVSTEEQKLDLQVNALTAAGCLPDDIYVEQVSATSKRRYQLDLAIKALREGDTLVVWRLDRLARSMRDLYARLDKISEAGAGFKSLTENFDFSSATGRFMLGIFGLVAELERQLIADRTTAGIAAWRARGGKPGAPPKVTGKIRKLARQMLKARRPGTHHRVWKHSLHDIAKACGVSVGTLKNHGLTKRPK